MAKPNTSAAKTKPEPTGETVTTRVNVAFPFSAIRIQEPTEDVVALATLLRDLTDLVTEVAPGGKARDIKARAEALVAKLS